MPRYVDALIDLNGGTAIDGRPARPAALTQRGSRPRNLDAVHCPVCHADDTKVVDSRLAEEGAAVRRRRHCLSCAHRFTTFERVDEVPLVVVKSRRAHRAVRPGQDRRRHPRRHQGPRRRRRAWSSRSPSRSRTACACRARRSSSAQIGLAVLDHLRTIDEVAYLRFASVYKNFDAAADFHREIELLTKGAPS